MLFVFIMFNYQIEVMAICKLMLALVIAMFTVNCCLLVAKIYLQY